jgi:uncharacterized membrane protein
MIENLYGLLKAIGFTHPLHPLLVHVPMGMVIGTVVFSLAGLIWQKENLDQTAYHCSVLALVAVIPTIIAGILDWQHAFGGEWRTLIVVKFVLGILLTVLLAIAVVLKQKGASRKQLLILYFLCLACAGGLGFSGGELVYG